MNKQIPSELSNGRLDTSYSDTIRSSDLPLFISPEIKTIRSSQKFGWKSLFAVHTVETPHKGYPNTTRFYVLSMPLTEAAMQIGNGPSAERIIVQEKAIIITDRFSERQCYLLNKAEFLHVFICPDLMQAILAEITGSADHDISFTHVFMVQDNAIRDLLLSIMKTLSEPANQSTIKINYLQQALCATLITHYASISRKQSEGQAFQPLTSSQINAIDLYLENHIGREVLVDELAELCGLGKTTFHARFKQAMGMTPYHYVIRYRAKKVRDLLMTTDMPLAKIAVDCGFANQAHLTSVFKRFFGKTPKAYKKAGG